MKTPEEILLKIINWPNNEDILKPHAIAYECVIAAMNEYADQFKPKKIKPIEERKKDFWRASCNVVGEFSDATILAFYEYWTEHSEGAKKMRFEKEKVFDIKKRLERWAKNQKTFNNGKSTKPTTDEAVNGFISK